MKYTDRLLKNKTFLEIMRHVKVLEKDRIYCHHELEHALDVARIAWIYYLEDESRGRLSSVSGSCPGVVPNRKKEGSDFGKPRKTLNIERKEGDFEFGEVSEISAEGKECVEWKDLFYVAALLHDIGRAAQYESGVHHSVVGLQIAAGILEEIEFPEETAQAVLAVVAEHPVSVDSAAAQKTERVSHENTGEAGKGIGAQESLAEREKGGSLPFETFLLSYISRADHDCRLCFFCEAGESCKWSEEERNNLILS